MASEAEQKAESALADIQAHIKAYRFTPDEQRAIVAIIAAVVETHRSKRLDELAARYRREIASGYEWSSPTVAIEWAASVALLHKH